MAVMSAEEAVACVFSLDDPPITCSEVPAFIEELAKCGYRLTEIPDWYCPSCRKWHQGGSVCPRPYGE